jgi:alkanesulfonate monooxygenase SsuD/methylene tetrahydromethanopterin reductase-like flavin-dependent oxidoreductase (luciferase family)
MQIGIDSFVTTGLPESEWASRGDTQRVSELLEEIELADRLGLDVYGIGEHHRPEYLASSPAVLLAAAAARTKRIRLVSAVNVLSSDDPIRLFQQFRNRRSDLGRARRDHRGARLLHRVLSAVRL